MLMGPQNLSAALSAVRERLARATAAAGRSAHSVTLLAVGKGQPAELLAAAADCGLEQFGESYLQEGLAKIAALQERGLTWHFIGRGQTNKTGPLGGHFPWGEPPARLKSPERPAAKPPPHAPLLNVCLQVNVAGEASKGGAPPAAVPELAAAVARLPRPALRALTCV